MGPLDFFAAFAAIYACACLQLRSQALKPRLGEYPSAPRPVTRALFILSMVCGGYAAAVLLGGYSATRTEALIFTAIAYTAHVLWRNVRVQSVARQMDQVFDGTLGRPSS